MVIRFLVNCSLHFQNGPFKFKFEALLYIFLFILEFQVSFPITFSELILKIPFQIFIQILSQFEFVISLTNFFPNSIFFSDFLLK